MSWFRFFRMGIDNCKFTPLTFLVLRLPKYTRQQANMKITKIDYTCSLLLFYLYSSDQLNPER